MPIGKSMYRKNVIWRKRGGLLLSAVILFAVVYFFGKWGNREPDTLERYIQRYGESPVVFSCGSGFYEEEVVLELTAPGKLPEGAAIYYTVDGTEPSESSRRYDGPVHLGPDTGTIQTADEDSAGKPEETEGGLKEEPAADSVGKQAGENSEKKDGEVEASSPSSGGSDESETAGASYDPQCAAFKTRVVTVRARLCQKDESTVSQGAVYAFGKDILQGQDEYIFCLDSDPEGLYDYERGILVGGRELAEGGTKYHGNYMKKGEDWVRPCHMAVFDSKGGLVMEQNIGLSVSGGMSRRLDQKSLNLDAGLPWGEEDGHFPFDIFADCAQADCAHVGCYTHLRLRARSQVTRSFRETLVGQLGAQSGYRSVSEPAPCKVYLNGTFYMLAEAEPTFSSSWLSHRFDLPDTDHIEKYKGKESSVYRKMKVTELFAADLTQEENRKALEAAVDMDDYLLYYAVNILDNDLDWPRNNVQAWRYTGDYVPGRPYTDGRIRFTLYDSDKAFDPDPSLVKAFGTDNFVSMMENIKRGYGSRFRDVMKADEYRSRLVTILCELMNTSFETQHVLSLLEEDFALARQECSPLFTAEYMELVEKDADMAAKAVAGYNDRIRKDLLDYFGLDQQYRMSVRTTKGVEVTWNNMLVSPDQEYDCSYYKGVPVCFTASALPGWTFDHWEVNGQPVEGEKVLADGKNLPSAENSDIETNVLIVDGSLLQDGICTVRAAASREEGERVLIAEISAAGSDDWIRLYNAGTTEADLGHYCISDDPAEPTKFRLPKKTLQPGESCRISGSKNEAGKADSLCSCNFMLSKNEILTLTPDRETGLAPDAVRVPYMSRDCTYGRRNNGNVLCWFDHREEAIPVLTGRR